MYARLLYLTQPEEELVHDVHETTTPVWPPGTRQLDRVRRMDLLHYLPDDLLVKTDRAAMGAGLECRSPLLDHRLVEFAFALPNQLLIRNGTKKWILRRVLQRHLPHQLIDRPKTGFSAPIADWLRGPLRAWASDLLAPECVNQAGFLNAAKITAVWQEHLLGRSDRSSILWGVLMFQAWLGHYKSQTTTIDTYTQEA
jgi:asparagine synthase (glutamine-hydrolysing)